MKIWAVKLGCVVRMVVDSILLHAESGPNDHRKDAPLFISIHTLNYWKKSASLFVFDNLLFPISENTCYIYMDS